MAKSKKNLKCKLFEEDVKDVVTMSVLREWILQVESRALSSEGIYRKCGTKSAIDKLVDIYDSAQDVNLSDYSNDIVASTLKQYLRTLKEPLTTYELYDQFLKTHTITEDSEKIQHLRNVLGELPNLNYSIIRYLLAHLQVVSSHQQQNLMSTSNLGMVFGPVFFKKDASDSPESAMIFLQDLSKLSACVKFMIEHFQQIFDMTVEEAHELDQEDYSVDWREEYGRGKKKKRSKISLFKKSSPASKKVTSPSAAAAKATKPAPTLQDSTNAPPPSNDTTKNATLFPNTNEQPQAKTDEPEQSSTQEAHKVVEGEQEEKSPSTSVTIPETEIHSPTKEEEKSSPLNTVAANQVNNNTDAAAGPSSPSPDRMPPPPQINIEVARQQQESVSPSSSAAKSPTTPASSSPQSHSATTSPSEHRRFNILSSQSEDREESTSDAAAVTAAGVNNTILSPQTPAIHSNKRPAGSNLNAALDPNLTPITPMPKNARGQNNSTSVKKIGKTVIKRSYSEFCYMLTTNPTILSILYNPDIISQSEQPALAKKLIQISYNLGTTSIMLRELLKLEFESHIARGNKSTGILRANNLLTKLLDEMVREEGSRYLRKIVKKHLLFIIDTENAKIVLNARDIKVKSKTQKNAILERNRQKLVALIDLFSRAITNERAQKKMPENIKFVCATLREMAKEKQLPPAPIVSNFLLLRMVNPVIVNPESLNVTPSSGRPITVDQKKILIMVSKVLQKIGNNAHFNKSDVDMHCMNNIVDKHGTQFAEFLERVGFTKAEMKEFQSKSDKAVTANLQVDSIVRDSSLIPLVKDVQLTLIAHEELVAKQEGFKKVTLDHLLYLYPDSQREQPEHLAQQSSNDSQPQKASQSRHTVTFANNDSGEGSFLIPFSEKPIELERPLESLQARIDDCRRKQGVSVIPDVLTMSNLQLVLEKQLLKRELHNFDVEFARKNGREPSKRDKEPLRSIYQRYKHVRLVMTSKGLSYPREVFDKIAVVAQMEEPLQNGNADDNGKKRSKYSLHQLTNDPRVAERLRHDPEYNKVRGYKREVQKLLHQYQDYFERKYGRKIRSRQDREVLKRYYDIYKFLKHEIVRLRNEVSEELRAEDEQ